MRRVLLVLALVVAAMGPSPLVPAQPAGEPVLLVLDASGSMNRVENGQTLLETAQDALRQIVLQLPADAQVGLRVYGHRTSNEDPVAGCVDTELVVPVGPVDREPMLEAIGSFSASGFTPIGLSLQEAAQDLDAVGGGTIILVSDGVDTCAPPDPCEVAEQLARQGFVTTIHTVGFRLDGQAAADQLQCIAEAGRGSFTRVDEVGALVGDLTGIVTDTLEGRFVPRIDGALAMELAPVLRFESPNDPTWPALDAWAEGTIAAGEVRWYAVDLPEGFHLLANASLDREIRGAADGSISIRIFDAAGVEIGGPHEVLGQIVDVPASMLLIDQADYSTPGAPPQVASVTAPRAAPPAWEGDEPWFAPTRDRFAAAGLNGGMYELWKLAELEPALTPGRYFIAFSWEADVEAISRHEIAILAYPEHPPVPERDQPSVVIVEDPTDAPPLRLEPVPWGDTPLLSGRALPDRALEVWSPAADGDTLEYALELADGEVLTIGWWVLTPAMSGGAIEWELFDSSGARVDEIDTGGWITGYDWMTPEVGAGWIAPGSGAHRLSGEVRDAGDDVGLLLAVFVFPEGTAGPPGEPRGLTELEIFLFTSNGRALMAGLEAVRAIGGGS
jgi:hypothetical protein